jgi:hypothetical protein
VFEVDGKNELSFRGGRQGKDAGVGGVTFQAGEGANYFTLAADATYTTDTSIFNPGALVAVSHWTNSVNLNQAIIHGVYPTSSLTLISNPDGRIQVNTNSADDHICVQTGGNSGEITITNKFDIAARITVTILRFNGI